ncbi:ABC transporter ATP-binding protein [Pseudonocardia sp. HH130630-07]|uniref:ABC transporter ATP-binding protein n=1 Tax=Pseudonocardia sp. HH130630-07 TaxID=1690815 RepID=UPI0008153F02|nr:ABC transporter ATP-binding protein [Pseudonocardia sp. HH130630-07]ANY06992.1 peptide ABC transporter ATP-binding protein [Pseudonocardia sp. HH130630-07]
MPDITDDPTAPGRTTVRAVGVRKTYGSGDAQVTALHGVSLSLSAGTFNAVMGLSGSGKSTLLQCLAGLDRATDGVVEVDGRRLAELGDHEMTALRRDHIGFVFQSFNLLPTLTAEENIRLPAEIAGRRIDGARFDDVVDRLGLRRRLGHRPSELSGGQQQRVAVARALVNRPAVVFADEPTGNLDSNSRTDLLEFLRVSVREFGQTVVMVTHDPYAASYADRVVFLRDGAVVHDVSRPTADEVLDTMKKLEG